jgi:hypothetical protein
MNRLTSRSQVDADGIFSHSGTFLDDHETRVFFNLTAERLSAARLPHSHIPGQVASRSPQAEALYFLLWRTLVREVLLR